MNIAAALLVASVLTLGSETGDVENPTDAPTHDGAKLQNVEVGSPLSIFRRVIVVGHRGTVEFAPENTLAAFEAAIQRGAHLLEIDIRTTSDGHLVLIHDATVDRTTNGTGRVADLTLEEIQALDAGSWFDPAFEGEKIPTLEEALLFMKGRALPDLDIKDADPKQLADLLQEVGMTEGITAHSGNWRVLDELRELVPGVLIRPTLPLGERGLDRLIQRLDPPIVNIDWHAFSPELIRRIQAKGKRAFINTMQAEDEKAAIREAIEARPDYIQSDRLEYLVDLLKQSGHYNVSFIKELRNSGPTD